MTQERPPAWSVIALALSVILFAGIGYRHARSAPLDELHGVRLGMTVSDVKAGFDEGSRGGWYDAPGCSGMALEWAPREPGKGPVRWARFEFHEGTLMGVRLRAAATDASAGGEPLETSSSAVIARQSMPGDAVAVALLARGCKEHQAEVEQLLGGGPMRR